MSDRALDTKDTASAVTPVKSALGKKTYVAPVLLHWGNFQEMTQSNGRGSQTDGRSGGRSTRGTN